MRALLFALLIALAAPAALAQTPADSSDVRRIVLDDGEVYVGTVVSQGEDVTVIRQQNGVQITLRTDAIAEITPLIRGRFFRTDPVRTRLFFAPTARTLGGGEFRADLSPYPSITAGLSDRVDLLASGFVTLGDGGILTPLVGLKGQVYSAESVQVALGVSALIALGGDIDGGFLAVPYGVVTFGDETRAFSLGLGGGIGGGFGLIDDVEVAEGVVVGAGGEIQLNNGVKLFVESLAGITGDEAGLLVLPGVRLFGDRFAFDVIGVLATDFETVFGFAPAGIRLSYTF